MSVTYGKFILFGDSITEFSSFEAFCYQTRLQELYSRKLDIINRGFSGFNSEHAKVLFPHILKSELNKDKDNVKLLVVFFGTNDAFQMDDDIGKIQALSPEKYKQNLVDIVQLAIGNNIKPIVVGPALHDSRLAHEIFREWGRKTDKDPTSNERNHIYSKIAESVATELEVPFVDMWNAFRIQGNWTQEQLYKSTSASPDDAYINLGDLVYDGIHFSALGYRIMYREVVKAIDTYYPEFKAENLPSVVPCFREIDPQNIEATLIAKR